MSSPLPVRHRTMTCSLGVRLMPGPSSSTALVPGVFLQTGVGLREASGPLAHTWGAGRVPALSPGGSHGRAGQASGETRHVPRPQELAQVGTLFSHLSPESSGDLGPFPATLHPEGTHTSYSQLRPVPAASPTALGGRWFSDGSSFSVLSSAPGMGSRCGRPPLPALLRDPLGQPRTGETVCHPVEPGAPTLPP